MKITPLYEHLPHPKNMGMKLTQQLAMHHQSEYDEPNELEEIVFPFNEWEMLRDEYQQLEAKLKESKENFMSLVDDISFVSDSPSINGILKRHVEVQAKC